ncbi:hypothetical protein HKX48_003452 [Thoreauomyces humboldtii]|nr:hypothetical protein HKX48_003452 [Thoreauomyces humboldtii]
MKLTITVVSALGFLSSASAATIAQTLATRPEISMVAAALSANPAWSAATTGKMLVAPTDASITADRATGNLAANDLGVFFLPTGTVIPTDVNNYHVVRSTANPTDAILFDNYVPQGPAEIHVRSSTQEGILTAEIQCDDGWLYISPIPFEAPVAPSVAMLALPKATLFNKLFQQINAINALNAQTGVTIFVPSDAAVTAATWLTGLAPNQLAYVLGAHIFPTSFFSTELNPGTLTSISGATAVLAVSGETSTIAGLPFGQLVDVPTGSGAMHTLDAVIKPATLPAADTTAVVTLGTIPVGAAAASSTAAVAAASSSVAVPASTVAITPAQTTAAVVSSSAPAAASSVNAQATGTAAASTSGAQGLGAVAGLVAAGLAAAAVGL